MEKNLELLKKLREPFPEKEISWLPKPTKAQTEEVKRDFKKGIRCGVCGAWHHPQTVHLAYVGHAAVTNRLLDVDPAWNWEYISSDENGMPLLDADGGMWINLTVLGITRKGYGDSDGKRGASATKERIGDAIRNAAMRFGVALELWHKGEFQQVEIQEEVETVDEKEKQPISDDRLLNAIEKIKTGEYSLDRLLATFELTEEQRKKLSDEDI